MHRFIFAFLLCIVGFSSLPALAHAGSGSLITAQEGEGPDPGSAEERRMICRQNAQTAEERKECNNIH